MMVWAIHGNNGRGPTSIPLRAPPVRSRGAGSPPGRRGGRWTSCGAGRWARRHEMASSILHSPPTCVLVSHSCCSALPTSQPAQPSHTPPPPASPASLEHEVEGEGLADVVLGVGRLNAVFGQRGTQLLRAQLAHARQQVTRLLLRGGVGRQGIEQGIPSAMISDKHAGGRRESWRVHRLRHTPQNLLV